VTNYKTASETFKENAEKNPTFNQLEKDKDIVTLADTLIEIRLNHAEYKL